MATTRDDIRTVPPAMDYRSHERQYKRFVHLTKWFVIHAVILLVALYAFLIAQEAITGTVLLALALAALGYGIFTTSAVREDIKTSIKGATDPDTPPE